MKENKTKPSSIIVAVGVFFVCTAGVLSQWYVQEELHIANDLDFILAIDSYDNIYDQTTDTFLGKTKSRSLLEYKIVQEEGNTAIVKNNFDVRTAKGEPIFRVNRTLAIDSDTKQHIDAPNVPNRVGYLFAPRMKGLYAQEKDKSPFTYWHVNYNDPINLVFESEELVHGLRTYKYTSSFTADQTQELTGALPEVGEKYGIGLEVDFVLWVEPYTGQMVTYRDNTRAYYYELLSKKEVFPWNSFENSLSQEAVKQRAEQLSRNKSIHILFSYLVPLVGIILLSIGIIWWLTRRWVQSASGSFSQVIRFGLLPSLVLIIGCASTWSLYHYVHQSVQDQITTEFNHDVSSIQNSIDQKMDIYIGALYGTRGLLASSNYVSRDEWRTYVDHINLEERFPGIQGIGYSIFVKPEEKDVHEQSIRNEGFPDFVIKPAGDRDIYSSIVYLEPFDNRNRQAFGFDMYQETNRRNAMNYARDNNTYGLSGKVTLVQEIDSDVQAGFLLYLPWYGTEQVLSLQERQNQIVGYVYSPFRMNDFMRGVINPEDAITLEIYDAPPKEISNDQVMYSNKDTSVVVADDVYTRTITYKKGGREWTMRYAASPGYGLDLYRSYAPWVVLSVGVGLSILLSVTMLVLNVRRQQAAIFAESTYADLIEKTKENQTIADNLRIKNAELAEASQELKKTMAEMEQTNKFLIGREKRMIELKKELKERDQHSES